MAEQIRYVESRPLGRGGHPQAEQTIGGSQAGQADNGRAAMAELLVESMDE